jgi:hypothetical protein
MEVIKGYKVFNQDWTCRGFQYEVGKIFEEDIVPKCCDRGFHFCLKASDCFNYYSSNHDNKVAEVVALGDIDYLEEDSKCCTNKIQILREISWDEVQQIANLGKNCTGVWNTGDCNTGDWNTGDCNTGDWNTGNRNTGDWNTGDWNTGNRNTGDWNTGNRNTGDWNTGDCNTGDWNTGDCNTGDWNTGNRNTGDWNTGDCNTGDWNKSSFNTGCFMTEQQNIMMFNKPSDWSYQDWLNSDARYYLNQIPKNVVEWIYESDMTDDEKEEYPTYKTTGGYLRVLDGSERSQLWWDGLPEERKNIIKSMPNFDADTFFQCTGIRVGKEII